jgi:hypothetical protein
MAKVRELYQMCVQDTRRRRLCQRRIVAQCRADEGGREVFPDGPNPARALDCGAGRFLFDLIDGSERWGGAGAAPVAAALELDPMGRG